MAKHQRRLALLEFFVVHLGEVPSTGFHAFHERLTVLDDARFDHLAQQVVSFTGTLTHTSKHRDAFVALGDVVDELHDQNRLAHTGTTKQANLSPLGVRLNEVDHFDAREQHVGRRAQVLELGRCLVNGTAFTEGTTLNAVDGLTHHIEQAALDAFAGGHRDACSGGLDCHAAAQTFRRLHGDGANGVLTDVLLGFENQVAFSALDHEGVENLGKGNSLGEADVNDWADDLCNGSLCGHWCGLLVKSKAKIVRSPRKSAPNFAQCECITTHLNFQPLLTAPDARF